MKKFGEFILEIAEKQGFFNALAAGSAIALLFLGMLSFVATILGTFFSIHPFTILIIMFIIYGLTVAVKQHINRE